MSIKQPVSISWAGERHMAAILDIEARSFLQPWTRITFLNILRQRYVIIMAAEVQDRVLGFMVYELHKSRLHLINFAVAPEFRRCGVGTQLVQKLIGKLHAARRTKILVEVSERNLDAQLFFRALGFRAESILPAFFDDGSEQIDAYLMEYVHPEASRSAVLSSEEVR